MKAVRGYKANVENKHIKAEQTSVDKQKSIRKGLELYCPI